jgi:hypothetical protein
MRNRARSRPGEPIVTIDRQWEPEDIGRGERGKHRVYWPAGCHDAGDRVLKAAPHRKWTRRNAAVDKADAKPAARKSGLRLQGIRGRNAEQLIRGGHRVRSERAIAGTSAQAGGISNDFAAYNRRLHPLGVGRDAAVDGYHVDLDRYPARAADAFCHRVGEFPVIPVARHRADPAQPYARAANPIAFIIAGATIR